MISVQELEILCETELAGLDRKLLFPGITADSREVAKDWIFVCLKGLFHDGHNFISDAIAKGAAIIIIQDEPQEQSKTVPVIQVPDTRKVFGKLAAAFQGNPSSKMDLIGITGTNGKTTTTYFVRSILRAAGRKAELIGTTGYSLNGKQISLPQTTPEADRIQDILGTFFSHGVEACAMEVSSHSLVFQRVIGCQFRGGVFTNITDREHLDFHKSFEAYLDAKVSLFREYISPNPRAFACINLDDPHHESFLQWSGDNPISYSMKADSGADVCADRIVPGIFGVSFDLYIGTKHRRVTIHLPGPYNVANALAAASVATSLGIPIEQIGRGLEDLPSVPGRFELIREGQDFAVVVDYAHTDDALWNLLCGARACNPRRIITVFGCGGDRDKTKRPRMGAIAAENSDVVFVTSDNPRTEEPEAIIRDILAGIQGEAKIHVIPSRREAIYAAVSQARKGDMVIIAGKGHEDYQIFKDKTIHFDDREEARNAIKPAWAARQ